MRTQKRQTAGADPGAAPPPAPPASPSQNGPATLTATQEASVPLINAALWGTVDTPSEAQLEKSSLNPWVVQLDTAVNTCSSAIPASLVAGWKAWHQGWIDFYGTAPSFLSASGDIERVHKLRGELKGFQDRITPYCDEAAKMSWTVSQLGAVAAVTGASGFFLYRAVKAKQYVLPTAALGLGLVGATFFLVSPKPLESTVDVPQENVTPPSAIDKLEKAAASLSSAAKIGIVVGGVLVGWVIYNNIKMGEKVLPQVLPKLLMA